MKILSEQLLHEQKGALTVVTNQMIFLKNY